MHKENGEGERREENPCPQATLLVPDSFIIVLTVCFTVMGGGGVGGGAGNIKVREGLKGRNYEYFTEN